MITTLSSGVRLKPEPLMRSTRRPSSARALRSSRTAGTTVMNARGAPSIITAPCTSSSSYQIRSSASSKACTPALSLSGSASSTFQRLAAACMGASAVRPASDLSSGASTRCTAEELGWRGSASRPPTVATTRS
jgi:hypothetical protein